MSPLDYRLFTEVTIVRDVSTLSLNIFSYRQQVKGKAMPLQAWTGPEGSRRLRLPDFKTVGT